MFTNLSALRQAHAEVVRKTRKAAEDAASEAGKHAQDRVRKTRWKNSRGGLAKATKFRVIRRKRGPRLILKNTAKHARPLEFGSRPHVITAGPGKMLRFRGRGGKFMFRKSVNHPGNRAYKFLWKAARSAHRVLGQRLKTSMSTIARSF